MNNERIAWLDAAHLDIPHSFMGKKTVIPADDCHVCPECGEIFFGPEAVRVVEEGMKRFDGEVAADFSISPQFIRQVWKKLNLGQKRQAASSVTASIPSRAMRLKKRRHPWLWSNC